jgi:hypothetical protein
MKVPLAFSLAQNADIDGEDTNRAATMKNACDLVPVRMPMIFGKMALSRRR